MNDQVTILKLMFNHFIPSEGNSIACVCVRERERERERPVVRKCETIKHLASISA